MSEIIASVEQWDNWFATVEDEGAKRAWLAARSLHTDPNELDRWAIIIEMNRISRATKEKTPTQIPDPG